MAQLHAKLLTAAIYSQEFIGTRQQISFASVVTKNLNQCSKINDRGVAYECKRSGVKTITNIVDQTGNHLFHYEQEGYNESELTQQEMYIKLTTTRKKKCLETYEKMKPYKVESILYADKNAKKMGEYSFVNDDNRISSAIITILYLLRCCLAHGDIAPDRNANEVYKYAYEVLIAPLKKLR